MEYIVVVLVLATLLVFPDPGSTGRHIVPGGTGTQADSGSTGAQTVSGSTGTQTGSGNIGTQSGTGAATATGDAVSSGGQDPPPDASAANTGAVEPKACPEGVYDSATGTAKFTLTESQCDVFIQLSKRKKEKGKKGKKKKDKGSKGGKEKKGGKGGKEKKGGKGGKEKKGGKGGKEKKTEIQVTPTKDGKDEPPIIEMRGLALDVAIRVRTGRSTGAQTVGKTEIKTSEPNVWLEGGPGGCPSAYVLKLKDGYLVTIGRCELVAIQYKTGKGKKASEKTITFSRPGPP